MATPPWRWRVTKYLLATDWACDGRGNAPNGECHSVGSREKPSKRRRIGLIVAVGVAMLLLLALGTMSFRTHDRHQRVATSLQQDLLSQLPKIADVRVLTDTAKHSVSGQDGGSSDCQATATVEVETTLTAQQLTRDLARTSILGTAVERRPGVLLVSSFSPLGSATLDWVC